MKRRGGLYLAGALVLVQMCLVTALPKIASAEGCANVSSFGAISVSVPVLPKSEAYAIWVRMQSNTTAAKVLVDANGVDCFEVGGEDMVSGQWAWQTYRKNGSLVPIQFSEREGNSLKIIGVEAGVKVDRILLTKPDCTPQEFGENCKDTVKLLSESAANHEVEMLPPPSNNPVSGKVVLSSTPERQQHNLKTVTYTVGGQMLQASSEPEAFDTTLLANGKYTVFITTTLQDGSVIRESTVIDVDNPENVLSPAIRWARINGNSILTAVIITGSVIGVAGLFWLARRWYLHRRERSFHGF